jgi:hypothetical protein
LKTRSLLFEGGNWCLIEAYRSQMVKWYGIVSVVPDDIIIGPPRTQGYFCFATSSYLIPSYAERGRIFSCTSSSFRRYGRP